MDIATKMIDRMKFVDKWQPSDWVSFAMKQDEAQAILGAMIYEHIFETIDLNKECVRVALALVNTEQDTITLRIDRRDISNG